MVALRRVFLLLAVFFLCLSSFAFGEEAVRPSVARVGMELGYPDMRGGFPVVSVLAGGAAARSGVEVGDVLRPFPEGEKEPRAFLDAMAVDLDAGFSVLLRGTRRGEPRTFWLRPLRFSSFQQEVIVFRLRAMECRRRGDALWKQGLESWDTFLYRDLSGEDLGARLSSIRAQLKDVVWELRNLEIPGTFPGDMQVQARKMRDAWGLGAEKRREALLLLRDYGFHEEERLSLQQGRRREAEALSLEAAKLDSRGGEAMLAMLRLASLDLKDLERLSFWEKGYDGGSSRHPLAFEAPLFGVPGPPEKGTFSRSALSDPEALGEALQPLLSPPGGADAMAFWMTEKLPVAWKGNAPSYLFVWTGKMWHQIALGAGESMGNGLCRNRATLRQQQQQNRFVLPVEKLPLLQDQVEKRGIAWMGMLGW